MLQNNSRGAWGPFLPRSFGSAPRARGQRGGPAAQQPHPRGGQRSAGGGPGCSPEQRGQEGAGAVPRPSMARTKSPPYARLRSFSSRSKLLALTISSTSEMSSSYLLLPRARCKTQSGRRALRTGVGDTHTRYPSPPRTLPELWGAQHLLHPRHRCGQRGRCCWRCRCCCAARGEGKTPGGVRGGSSRSPALRLGDFHNPGVSIATPEGAVSKQGALCNAASRLLPPCSDQSLGGEALHPPPTLPR